MAMTMVDYGHEVLAQSVFNEDFHLAWGKTPDVFDTTGWDAGDTPPAETSNTTDLMEEIGRRVVTLKAYVYEDPSGTIIANGTKWKQSVDPTRHIYLQFKFDASDAVDKVIRQIGLFQGTVHDGGQVDGTTFMIPSELTDEGTLFMYQNIEPVSRNASTREIYEYVITF
jgi:hypothetical protein